MGRCYPHLNLKERRKLAKWLEAKIPTKEIASNLHRAPSTIYREIKRNYYRDDELPQLNGYHAIVAQDAYEERRAVHRKLIRHPQIMAAVRSGFDAGWSPEQIAGRMKLERHPMRVSHETIYRHLPEHRHRRRVIPPFSMGSSRRIQAAVLSFIAGVMPPMPMLGRSLL
jgi:transposase, IS30 family